MKASILGDSIYIRCSQLRGHLQCLETLLVVTTWEGALPLAPRGWRPESLQNILQVQSHPPHVTGVAAGRHRDLTTSHHGLCWHSFL